MDETTKLIAVTPGYAIPGGEIAIDCIGFSMEPGSEDGIYMEGMQCRIVAASSKRVLAIVPNDIAVAKNKIEAICQGTSSNTLAITIGTKLADGMHIVANPAVDPEDDALILTRSGSRGQHLSTTLFRLEKDGYLEPLPDAILNPTGIAFDTDGNMFVTNRAQGEIYAVDRKGSSTLHASNLGIATGLAFGQDGLMYVGDRSGTVYRIKDFAEAETFTVMDASVAAYHLAFSPDGRLFMTAPALASYDAVYAIDQEGFDEKFFRGLGRPQGLAFDTEANVYVAACYQGRHGIVKIAADGQSAENFVAGNNVVGLCFTRDGDMVVATNDTVFSVPCGIQGTLL